MKYRVEIIAAIENPQRSRFFTAGFLIIEIDHYLTTFRGIFSSIIAV